MARVENSSWDRVETMRLILASLQLQELSNLTDLVINFGRMETYNEDSPYLSNVHPWADTEQAWMPLEIACAARGITCVMRHLE